MTGAASSLAEFYCRNGSDHRGQTFDALLRLDDTQLEQTHDYIQWLFPTVTVSRFNPDAPALDASTANTLRTDPAAQRRLRQALLRMLAFYGFELDDDDPTDPEVFPATNFETRARVWLNPGNHNYRRITRILESLTILDRRPLARALFRCLDHLYRTDHGARIGEQTLAYWRRQVE